MPLDSQNGHKNPDDDYIVTIHLGMKDDNSNNVLYLIDCYRSHIQPYSLKIIF